MIRENFLSFTMSMQRLLISTEDHPIPSLANADRYEFLSNTAHFPIRYYNYFDEVELSSLLLPLLTPTPATGNTTCDVIFSFLIALFIPSNVERSLINMARAKSLIAFRPIFSCRSCQPANSAATTPCVYRSSLPNSLTSSLVLRTLSSFSSFRR